MPILICTYTARRRVSTRQRRRTLFQSNLHCALPAHVPPDVHPTSIHTLRQALAVYSPQMCTLLAHTYPIVWTPVCVRARPVTTYLGHPSEIPHPSRMLGISICTSTRDAGNPTWTLISNMIIRQKCPYGRPSRASRIHLRYKYHL